jgi:hypothetical protein
MNTKPLFETRTDCIRDNRAIPLPNASTLGFGLWKAKRGCWIVYEQSGFKHCGRSVGRVTCEGKTYVEVAVISLEHGGAHIRWIDPAEVRTCRRAPPKRTFDFICGDWSDMQSLSDQMAHGFSLEPADMQAPCQAGTA